MTEQQILEAAQAAYEAYWTELEGELDGVRLPCWNALSADQLAAILVGVAAVETYINAIPA